MSEIDIPSIKQRLWHRMRGDLTSLVPYFSDNDLLLCPTCFRRLGFEDFSVEHIIPKQALACDPPEARLAIPQNERSGLTLLCRRPLIIKNRKIPGNGCNSWKGKYYDPSIREFIQSDLNETIISTRHQISLFSVGYLALFREFGYQISLLTSGLLMRSQYFNPNSFVKNIPVTSQIILAGEKISNYSENERNYWSDPFKITVNENSAQIVMRNACFSMPLSRDPRKPLARSLLYVPPKYTFRPDLRTAFD
ncbi:hypothetical protein FHT36_001478 [Xanthobacter sp. SG618]|uniref:hypothetical protein n=1 Tax=Xanthobacter sp. SG618 TaxID=2587121 RepID=UPI00145EDAE2|nr:hypothetical protein [Xanthobacter sp. SG618]NMN57581.1 hypothetical protein [Xanthobacter sp. SG618]